MVVSRLFPPLQWFPSISWWFSKWWRQCPCLQWNRFVSKTTSRWYWLFSNYQHIGRENQESNLLGMTLPDQINVLIIVGQRAVTLLIQVSHKDFTIEPSTWSSKEFYLLIESANDTNIPSTIPAKRNNLTTRFSHITKSNKNYGKHILELLS